MPTERQSESARINGAKSHGPISAEGKEKSSRNSLRHGCTASHTIILACEDPKDFERMVEKYDTMYKPVTLEEQNLVDEMFASASRLRRATPGCPGSADSGWRYPLDTQARGSLQGGAGGAGGAGDSPAQLP